MPRLTNSLPKYRKHKASGQAVVTLAGRDHYLGPHNTAASKREYERLTGEWLAAGRPCQFGVNQPTVLSVVEVMARYMAQHVRTHYLKAGTPTSEVAAIKCALRPLRELYGRVPVTEFGPRALKAVREKMIDRGLARGTVNQNIGRIKRMFKWAASEELVPADVSVALQSVSGLQRGRTKARETDPVGPVDDKLVDAVLPHLRPAVAAMVQLQRVTGMRPGEVTTIRPCDVRQEDDVWIYTPSSHKTEHHGTTRKVFIGPRGQSVLSPFLEREVSEYCFSPRAADGCVKARRCGGRHYRIDSYRNAIQRACRKLGVETWSPNQLRHSRATEIRHLHGLEAAQVTLGHNKADVTQVYAERDFALAAQIATQSG